MQIYLGFYYLLAWSATVSVLGFVTFAWGMVAYKIWHGNKPIDEDMRDQLLYRSFCAGWVLGVAAIVIVFLDYLTTGLDLPPGPVHMVYYLFFLSLAGWAMMYYFSLEDFIQGLILAVIYLYIPTAVLMLFQRWNPLYRYVESWLEPLSL